MPRWVFEQLRRVKFGRTFKRSDRFVDGSVELIDAAMNRIPEPHRQIVS